MDAIYGTNGHNGGLGGTWWPGIAASSQNKRTYQHILHCINGVYILGA